MNIPQPHGHPLPRLGRASPATQLQIEAIPAGVPAGPVARQDPWQLSQESVCRATSPGMRSKIRYISEQAGKGQWDISQPNLFLHLRAETSCPSLLPHYPGTAWMCTNIVCHHSPQPNQGRSRPALTTGALLSEGGKPEAAAIREKAHLRGTMGGSRVGTTLQAPTGLVSPASLHGQHYRLDVSHSPYVILALSVLAAEM